MSIHLELKPDRNLLDSNFEGYKLSLDTLSTIRHQLQSPIKRVPIDPKHHSFLQAKIFGLHNFLFGETTDNYEHVYFIDKDRHVQKASVNPYTNQLDVCKVWTVPMPNTSDCEHYNVSMKLVSETLVLLNNGCGTIFMLETGDRSTDIHWQLEHCIELDYENCYIQDAVLKDANLHFVICKIQHEDKKAELGIKWITFRKNNWQFISCRELLAKGDVTYIQLERTCEAIYVTSSLGCKFIRDTLNPVMEVEDENTEEKNCYKWSQDPENVVIHFILPEDVKKEDVKVNSGAEDIKVEYKDSSLLQGVLFGKIDNELTTFTLSKNLLEINLIKASNNENWSCLLSEPTNEDSITGNEVKVNLDHITSEKEEDPPQGITFNTEQVEECDFSDSDLTTFERICVKTHKTTHRYNFGSNGILLTTKTDPNLPLSLGIRSDVDVCIYEPQINDTDFKLEHVSTLLAFGYIQASKQQKKFLACPPDASYSIVCKTNRHLFLYRQNKNVTSGELKNRRTGARIGTIAQQQVISLPDEEIYGVYVSNNSIFLLGESFLIHLKIKNKDF